MKFVFDWFEGAKWLMFLSGFLEASILVGVIVLVVFHRFVLFCVLWIVFGTFTSYLIHKYVDMIKRAYIVVKKDSEV